MCIMVQCLFPLPLAHLVWLEKASSSHISLDMPYCSASFSAVRAIGILQYESDSPAHNVSSSYMNIQ